LECGAKRLELFVKIRRECWVLLELREHERRRRNLGVEPQRDDALVCFGKERSVPRSLAPSVRFEHALSQRLDAVIERRICDPDARSDRERSGAELQALRFELAPLSQRSLDAA
jgi:hypothetical protein